MGKLLNYLKANRVGQLATLKDCKPVLRPFQFQFVKEGKFYFVTANTKAVYKQLSDTGVAGFAVMGKDMKWVRVKGYIQFIDSLELKEEVLKNEPTIRNIYKRADNPIFEIFYMHEGTASLHEFGGELIEEIEI